MLKRTLPVVVGFFLASAVLRAATYVVPDDRTFMHGARIVIIASPLSSYTRLNPSGSVETVTTFSIEEVIKGKVDPTNTVDIIEPGGVFRDRATIIPGIPRFEDGGRYLLFILPTDSGWHVLDMSLGKFTFATDLNGRKLLIRDEEDIVGWDPNGNVHAEPRRDATPFLAFLRTEAGGGMGAIDYYVPRAPVKPDKGPQSTTPAPLATTSTSLTASTTSGTLQQAPAIAPYTANSYTYYLSGTTGGRWNIFPNAVTFYSVGTEPGAPGGGSTAISAGMAAWNNDAASNVNYVYGGADTSGTHTGGVNSADGQNTVAFEQDLSSNGIAPFQCTVGSNGSFSYSGTLGLGGITNGSGTHTGPNNETFVTAHEGDVAMNRGIANCTPLFNSGDFNSALAHELGHTLGFRHADQTRDQSGASCSTDPSLECSTTAIMKSFITTGLNAALQPYDQHAVQAVYPGTSGGGTTPPKTTVVFTDDPLQPGVTVIKAIHLSELRTAVDQIRAAAGLGGYPYTDAASAGLVVKAIHIQQLRTALDEARSKLGLSTGGWTDPSLAAGTVIKAVHFQEIRNKTKCGC